MNKVQDRLEDNKERFSQNVIQKGKRCKKKNSKIEI